MYHGLTSTAKHVVNFLAQNEANKCRADEITPEHIVLALLKEGSGIACRILRTLNIDTDGMYTSIVKKISAKRSGISISNLHYSTRGKKILEDAVEEAHSMGDEYVGTAHLILAAAHEFESITAKYLSKNNVSASILKDMIKKTQLKQEGTGENTVNRIKVHTSVNPTPKEEQRLHTSKAHSKRRSPVLDEFATELTKKTQAEEGMSVIGREKELTRIVQVLVRRNKNNPLLIGEPGVGKTAIVEGLAHIIASGKAPPLLTDKRILSVDLTAIVAGTKYRGEFEERLKRLMKEAQSDKNIILFIDEVHMLIGAGGAEGAIDAANIFKPALSRGEIQCIGATTVTEYTKHIEKDAALARRFQTIIVDEPTTEEAIKILHGIKGHYEKYHGVKYSEKAIQTAVIYAKRYISERFLPDKAIDVIDEVGARHQIVHVTPPKIIVELQKKIAYLNTEKIDYVNAQNYERAALIRDEIHKLEAELAHEKETWHSDAQENPNYIYEHEIMEVIADISRVPITHLAESEMEKLRDIENELRKKVIGQDEAINIIAAVIRKSKIGLHSPHKPIGSFLFLGPSGVGKTLLAKELAFFMFGDHNTLIRIDMSDYMEKHTVSRLVGAPPGYVGFHEGGDLTERVRRKPYSIILFDEIEKAHRDFFNILLQVLEEGELQDNLGHTVSFRNTIIIMTSNIGTRSEFVGGSVGFIEPTTQLHYEKIKEETMSEVRQQLRPEFLNRVDVSVVFKPLAKSTLETIFDLLFMETRARAAEREITLLLDKSAKKFIIDEVARDKLGARPLRRAISLYIEEPLSLGIVSRAYGKGDTCTIFKKNKAIIIEKKDIVPQLTYDAHKENTPT